MAKAYKKSREPIRLSDDDYMNFTSGIVKFGQDHSGDPDAYPKFSGIPPLKTTFDQELQDYIASWQTEQEKHERMTEAAKEVNDDMVGLRRMLPALFGNDHMLDDFSLREAVPTDIDKLLLRARECRDHWNDVSGQPEYAPLAPKFTEFVNALNTLETGQQEYADAVRAREVLQNAKEASREALHNEERRMFNWYRGLHTAPKDEWWTETPWGASSGGNGGGGDKLGTPKNHAYDADKMEFSWDAVDGAAGYELEISEDGTTWTNAYSGAEASYVKDDLTQGGWFSRVRATKGDLKSKWSDVIELLIPFGKPNLQYKAVARLLWCNPVPGAVNYQFQCDDPAMGIVQTGPNPTYVVPTPQTDDWNFRVRAGNMEGQWGEWSEWLLVPVV